MSALPVIGALYASSGEESEEETEVFFNKDKLAEACYGRSSQNYSSKPEIMFSFLFDHCVSSVLD